MKKLFKNQSGFSHHFLLPVLVIVAVSGIGTYVLQRSRAAANVYDDAKTTLVKKQEDPKRGLTYNGLKAVKKNAKHPCAGLFEVQRKNPKDPISCTHGPDPAPVGVDLTDHAAVDKKVDKIVADIAKDTKPTIDEKSIKAQDSVEQKGTTAAQIWYDDRTTADISWSSRISNKCVGDGQDGRRIVMIYAYTQGHDNYATVEPTMQRLTQAMQATAVGNSLNSAPAGAAAKVLRFRHDANCKPIIFKIKLPGTATQNFDTVYNYLASIGYNRSDRKYVAWVENPVDECGMGSTPNDDRPSPNQNVSNYHSGLSVIGKGCWSLGVTLHELFHNFGAVQLSAPFSNLDFHCTEVRDFMCNAYSDYPQNCDNDDVVVGLLDVYNIDCRDNDYWAATRTKLSGRWNTYNSAYLTTSFR